MMENKQNWKSWVGKGMLSVLIALVAVAGLLSVIRQTAQAMEAR